MDDKSMNLQPNRPLSELNLVSSILSTKARMAGSFGSQMLAGSAFGIALAASGVWAPSIVVEQMQFKNFLMIQVFLSAVGIST